MKKSIIIMFCFALLVAACNRISDNPAKGAEQCVTELSETISKDKNTSLDDILEKYWKQYQGKERIEFFTRLRTNLWSKSTDDVVLALGSADYSAHPLYKEYLTNILDIAYKEGISMLNNLGGKPAPSFKNTPSTAALLTGSLLADYSDTNNIDGINKVLSTTMNRFRGASLWEKVEFSFSLKRYFKSGDNGAKAFRILSDSQDKLAMNFKLMMLESNIDL